MPQGTDHMLNSVYMYVWSLTRKRSHGWWTHHHITLKVTGDARVCKLRSLMYRYSPSNLKIYWWHVTETWDDVFSPYHWKDSEGVLRYSAPILTTVRCLTKTWAISDEDEFNPSIRLRFTGEWDHEIWGLPCGRSWVSHRGLHGPFSRHLQS